MDLSKETKLSLSTQLEKTQSDLQITTLNLQRTVEVANFFTNKLFNIEQAILNSPAKNVIGKIWWLITNAGAILQLLNTIKENIREWRRVVDDLNKAQAEANNTKLPVENGN